MSTLGKIFADDDHRDAGGAEIFLRAGEDEAEFLYVSGKRSNVGGHVGDERYVPRVGHGGPLRAFDGVLGAEVHVGSVRRQFAFARTRQTQEIGRASCRERVKITEVGGSAKRKCRRRDRRSWIE